MNDFRLHLQSSTQYEKIENVLSFVGEDSSGSFGVLPGRERFMTCLTFGLARFRYASPNAAEVTEYLAIPGAVLYFAANELFICTRDFVHSENYELITDALDRKLRAEEENISGIKRSLHRLDEEVLRRLIELKSMRTL